MGIVDEDVVKVRESSDIVAVVGQHTQLRRVGQRWTGLCPFHTEKSPSFSVNATDGLYYCFGCRASGDVITFVREMEHLDFVGAVEWLANKAGITLRYTERNESESRKRLARLYDVMERAVDWYHDRLLSAPDAGTARGYLRSRGFDRDVVDQFRVGWAPDGWDELVNALKVPTDVLEDCGLGFVNRRNRRQDFFRSRILFPIFDDRGRPVAFGGRKLPHADGPKYQNSRENVLYNKSGTLYALNWAKADVVTSGEAIVCEGYTDVIGFFGADLPRAVATCGTALTEDHIKLLKRFTNRVVLAYDADEAGQAAAERVYEWEQRHEIEIAVLALPPGTDPDELARSDPAALRDAVRDAKAFLGFRVDRVLAAANLRTPEGRARAASAALDVVAEHPSPLVRDQYVMQIADACRFEAEQLREQLRNPRPKVATPAKPATPRDGRGEDPPERARIRTGAEIEALRMMVQRPTELSAELGPWLFTEGPVRRAYEALAETGSLHVAIDDSDPAVADLLRRLSVEESTAEADDVLVRLVESAVTGVVARMENEARTADDPLEYEPAMRWLKLNLDDLRGDEPAMDALGQLLDWLAEHAAELPC
jgi:DNA primase